MCRPSVATLLLASAFACLPGTASPAVDRPGGDAPASRLKLPTERMTMRYDASSAAAGDTVWIGFSTDAAVTNHWRVGPGPARALAPGYATSGAWQWDAPVHGDSLQGWWPVRHASLRPTGPARPDVERPWSALATGNQACYVIDQGRFVAGAPLPAPGNRTFGVVGVWHSDPGDGVPGPQGAGGGGVGWTPLAGARSAWMGLRQHGDATVVDAVTGQPFDAAVLAMGRVTSSGAAVTTAAYPGYADGMDQMLYRDIEVGTVPGPLTLSFRFATRMSTARSTDAATRTGWFEGDPLTVNAVTPGNFVSAEAGVPAGSAAPVDSFQVYVGRPVEGTWLASDGVTRAVYDPLRRWFNEVLDRRARFWKLGACGDHAPQVASVVVTADELAAIRAGGGTTLRVVFRVHTNGVGSDESGPAAYTSHGAGAAQVDEVTCDLGAGPVLIGDFEGGDPALDIDNSRPAAAAWRSTGKPPAVTFHAHEMATLPFNDMCGDINSSVRICDLRGGVISMGDHDQGEAAGGLPGTTEAEGAWGMVSPTINLRAPATGKNGWGLDAAMALGTQGYAVAYDIYAGIFDLSFTGAAWQLGAQSYPAPQPAGGPAPGTPQWGDLRVPDHVYFDPDVHCFPDFEDLSAQGLVLSANSPAPPDSVRILLRLVTQCWRFGVTAGCAPTVGAYFDNVSFVILDGPPRRMSVDIVDLFHDAFPFNETSGLPGTAAFDTTAALIRTGRNIAPETHDLMRFEVPGDSAVVQATPGPGEAVRVDLVFRIKPGVGDHVVPGNPASGLRKSPTSTARAVAGDGSFWGQYLADAGEFATPGYAALDAAWPGGWNPNVWRSARCDTAQCGLFPRLAAPAAGDCDPATPGALPAGRWMSTYHEADPHFASLGIPRPMCFLVDTLGPAHSGNIVCGTAPAWLTALPSGRTGWAGNLVTLEGTPILPDGLLTPGAHVQYFFTRRPLSAPSAFEMVPDTTRVFPQPGEGSYDAHRWQQFGVLPDRWKDFAFGGSGMACMLYVDGCDRWGDERAWVSAADTLGATAYPRWGAHNGWMGPGGVSVNDPTYFVRAHGGQPGTTWDMYGVRGAEALTSMAGGIGGRLAFRDPTSPMAGRESRIAPTAEMLEYYYKLVMLHTGSLDRGVLGPYPDRSSDDIAALTNFLVLATPSVPRGLFTQGDGFAEALWSDPFLTDMLGFDILWGNYRELSGQFSAVSDLRLGPLLSPVREVYGLRHDCWHSDDVLIANPAIPEAQVGSEYAPVGASTFAAAVVKPASVERPWVAWTDGFDIGHFLWRFGQPPRCNNYLWDVLSNIFGAFCVVPWSSPWSACRLDVGDDPASPDFARLAGNPARDGRPVLLLGLERADRVRVTIHDVAGRRVRALVDRLYPAGSHRVVWDGADDHGHEVARGVYFARVRYGDAGFERVSKMVVLR